MLRQIILTSENPFQLIKEKGNLSHWPLMRYLYHAHPLTSIDFPSHIIQTTLQEKPYLNL